MFGIDLHDIATVGFLVFLEGILSIDNALVLALLVSPLPHSQRNKALSYGLIGAVVFRTLAISIASFLMKWTWVKFVGGGYLIYLAADFWLKGSKELKKEAKARGFWTTVLIVELTDIAFAADSILTAVALTNKLWVVVTGGVIGLILMRFAASVFVKLLEKFPRFESTAYVLVFIIGGKLFVDGFQLPFIDFHSAKHPAFWIFWIAMTAGLVFGFTQKKTKR